jgi:hypothetical protein
MSDKQTSADKNIAALSAENTAGGMGVFGESKNGGQGVVGFSDTFQGVYGRPPGIGAAHFHG